MLNTKFEVYKLSRELKRSGKNFEFVRPINNEFGEPSSETQSVGVVRGLFHQSNEPDRELGVSNEVQFRDKPKPCILCIKSEVSALGIKEGDKTTYNGKTFVVTTVSDIQEWGLISDIFMEVVDDGNNV